jgi:chaperonin GroEL
MVYTKSISGEEAQEKVKVGVDLIANPVGSTLGAKGRFVLINKKGAPAYPTKDGVTVAMSIFPPQGDVGAGAKVIQEAAIKAVDLAGDGTTTTAVLAQAMITQGFANITEGANPIDIKRGIDLASREVVKFIRDNSEEIKDDYKKIGSVGAVSANNDKEIGNLIAKAMKEVTSNGVVKVKFSGTHETSVEVNKGMEFDQGYMSPQMITDSHQKIVEYNNPLFILTEDTLSSITDFQIPYDIAVKQKRALIIVCGGVTGDFAATMILNFRKNEDFKVGFVKADGMGELRKEFLDDLAAFTGATVMSKSYGKSLKDTKTSDFGAAGNIISTSRVTTILSGAGDKKNIDARVASLKKQLEGEDNPGTIKYMKERIAKLVGGIGIINVGAYTELEAKEKKDRVDDALKATSAAVKEGIVPGGGVMFLKAKNHLKSLPFETNKDINTGIQIVINSLDVPTTLMLKNAGIKPIPVIAKIRKTKSINYGYDLNTDKTGDMKKAGIIDPSMVLRVAIESAASVAGVFLTVDHIVIDA